MHCSILVPRVIFYLVTRGLTHMSAMWAKYEKSRSGKSGK